MKMSWADPSPHHGSALPLPASAVGEAAPGPADLLGFVALAFTVSWSLWLLQPWLTRLDPLAGQFLGVLGAYGPSLAAVLIGWRASPARRRGPRPASQLVFPALTLLASLWLTGNDLRQIPASSHPLLAAILGVAVALLPAGLVWIAASGRARLGSLLAWRVGGRWWLAALGMVGVSYLLAFALLAALGQPWPPFPRTEVLPELLRLVPFVFLSTLLYGGPLGEEAGWRGVALPGLLRRFDPLLASVILGVLWGLWHLPLHLQGVYDGAAGVARPLWLALLVRVGSGLSLSIIMTWLYLRTGGNLLLMVILHTATNLSTGWLMPLGAGTYLGTIGLAVTLAVQGRMWRRPPERGHAATSRATVTPR